MRFGLGFSPTPSILAPKSSSERVESGMVAGRNCEFATPEAFELKSSNLEEWRVQSSNVQALRPWRSKVGILRLRGTQIRYVHGYVKTTICIMI